MAARRLLIVMLILLGISSAIAVIVPEPSRDDSPSNEAPSGGGTGETGATGGTGASGDSDPTTGRESTEPPVAGEAPGPGIARQVSVKLDGQKPERIEAEPGAHLILSITSDRASSVEIEGLGLTGFADPFAPAVFDVILPGEPDRYEIRAPGEDPAAVIVTS